MIKVLYPWSVEASGNNNKYIFVIPEKLDDPLAVGAIPYNYGLKEWRYVGDQLMFIENVWGYGEDQLRFIKRERKRFKDYIELHYIDGLLSENDFAIQFIDQHPITIVELERNPTDLEEVNVKDYILVLDTEKRGKITEYEHEMTATVDSTGPFTYTVRLPTIGDLQFDHEFIVTQDQNVRLQVEDDDIRDLCYEIVVSHILNSSYSRLEKMSD